MINPRISKKTASTNTIIIIFCVGLISTSSVHLSVSSILLATTNNIDLGIIGDHYLIALVPFIDIATVNYSTKLLDLPIPI